MDTVGVIGAGGTGGAVAHRLLEHGFPVTVHDRDAGRTAVMVRAGARAARLPADAAEPADVVFVHVPDEAAAEEVLFDCGGVGETLRDGGVVVVASPGGPGFVRAAAARLAVLGLDTVEAWFPGAAQGTAAPVLLGGGPRAVRTVGPVLDALSGSVAHIGPVGSVAELRLVLAAAAVRHPATGPLSHRELGETIDAVRGRARGRQPGRTATPAPGAGDCLGLGADEFAQVIGELEQRFGIPLLREALRCGSSSHLVAVINTQVTSGV